MTRIRRGSVFTNGSCIGCNKCISGCPVMGANVSVYKNGKNVIEVDAAKCIHCGHCLEICTHGAREYIDDTNAFLDDLQNGSEISLLIAPSFYLLYPDTAKKMLGYLKSLGARAIYDVAFGADICAWRYLKYFDDNMDENGVCKAFISSACPAVTEYISRVAPELQKFLIPVASPAQCLAKYVSKYLGDRSKLAFISPCVTKRDEIASNGSDAQITYSVTFAHLVERLSGIELDGHSAESDLLPIGYGGMFPTSGGFRRYIARFLPADAVTLDYSGIRQGGQNAAELCRDYVKGAEHPLFIDLLNCDNGCIGGPAAGAGTVNTVGATVAGEGLKRAQSGGLFAGESTRKDRRSMLDFAFSELDPKDFDRKFEDKYRQPCSVPEDTYEEIFLAMGKRTEGSRRIDCRACGYSTCRNMAAAIALGYNRKENCVQYAKEELIRLGFTDTLTGIRNEAAFLRDAAEMIRENAGIDYAICVLDVNSFKVINDMFGFEAGDAVLCALAERTSAFTNENGICARLDTDRFAMLFPYDENHMSRLKAADSFDFSSLGVTIPVTASFGIYVTDPAEQNIKGAIDHATLAQNKTSGAGHNTVTLYTEDMRRGMIVRADITSHMREALRLGEFKAYLQPQFNHSSGALAGAETLCRWIKPDGSVISPGEFIPIFEQNGFIRELDRYMWEEAFRLMRSWLDRGLHPVPISTNISRVSLFDSGLSNVFRELVKKYGVKPSMIHLEITESAYMSNQKQIISTVRALQGQGFEIAMDDFGSGYSSLNTLKDVPIDILKLDMGFMRGDAGSDRGGNILSSITRMAQNLRLKTIAEGVETIDQADYLASVGCDIIQGYLYARPMPVEEYEKLLSATKRQYIIERPRFMNAINVNHLFDPSFGESRMFDNYAGAAVILEYERGEVSIIRINEKYLQAIGMDNSSFEHIRAQFFSSLSKDSRKGLTLAINDAIKTGQESVCVTERSPSKGGSPIWIKSHFWCIASNGERHVLYGLAENISTEKNSELEMTRANSQLNMILDYSPTGICLFRIVIRNGKISTTPLNINRGFLDMIGATREELRGVDTDSLMLMVHPDDREQLLRETSEALAGERKLTAVYRTLAKNDDGFIWVKLEAAAMEEEDGSFLAFMNFTDYTREKKIETHFRLRNSYRAIMQKNAMASFRFNLSHNICDDAKSDAYPYMLELQAGGTVDSFFENVYRNMPNGDIRDSYMAVFNREALIRSFNNGYFHHEIDHRFRVSESDLEWITTYIDMMPNPASGDIEAFIYALDINKKKINEMIISYVAEYEYDFMMFIDIPENSYIFFSSDESGSAVSGKDYAKFARDFVISNTAPSDTDRILSCFLPDELARALTDRDSISFGYRSRGRFGDGRKKSIRCAYLDRKAGQMILTERDVTPEDFVRSVSARMS